MATVKKNMKTTAPEWWVHLRSEAKRKFWKSERKAQKVSIEDAEEQHINCIIDKEVIEAYADLEEYGPVSS